MSERYRIERQLPDRLYVVTDVEGYPVSGFGHATEADAQREIDKLTGNIESRRVAVRCNDGCGYKGYRTWPSPEKPCPRCGAPVDAGHPYRGAMMTKRGQIGGRTELIWGDWT